MLSAKYSTKVDQANSSKKQPKKTNNKNQTKNRQN